VILAAIQDQPREVLRAMGITEEASGVRFAPSFAQALTLAASFSAGVVPQNP